MSLTTSNDKTRDTKNAESAALLENLTRTIRTKIMETDMIPNMQSTTEITPDDQISDQPEQSNHGNYKTYCFYKLNY